MAVIKVTNSKATLSKSINYITKEEKTEEKLISGKDCTPSTAFDEMQATKELFNKLNGRQYYHYVQSFSKTDNVSHGKAHEIGKEWAEKNFKGHEVLIATHQDKDHVHNHFIVNSVSYEDGKKFHSSKKDLEHMKLVSDKICEREGLSVIQEKNKSNELTSYNQGKYQLLKKLEQGQNVKSYVFDTALTVDKVLENSSNRGEFIKNMKDQGYEVKWSDTNKNITFKNSEGNKVRLSNLEKTFKDTRFSKEGLEHEFSKSKGKELTESSREQSRAEGDKSRGTEHTIDQTPGAEYESKNGVRKHSSKREFGDIEETIRRVEHGIKGNSRQETSGDNGALRTNQEPSKGTKNEQSNVERNLEPNGGGNEPGHKAALEPTKSKVRSRDWDFER